MKGETEMRMSANHRKLEDAEVAIGDRMRFIMSRGRNWFYMVDDDMVGEARSLGFTVVRQNKTPTP